MGGFKMIYVAGRSITTPLGRGISENFDAILEGKSKISLHEGTFGLPEPFYGSLLDRAEIEKDFEGIPSRYDENDSLDFFPPTPRNRKPSYTFFEKLCILTVYNALMDCDIDPKSKDTIFILSTTKGNVDVLEEDENSRRCYLTSSLDAITDFFENPNKGLVVSNACISGVCAQIAGARELKMENYKHAIIIGCDVLSRFIVSGFQSFKALGSTPCKPYDKTRDGLNLGEACGVMILSACEDENDYNEGMWCYVSGSIHNDANHISGPSRTGEGSYRVLNDLLHISMKLDLAFINTHGTATAYNDEMESIAIHRAELDDVPVSALKGFYGHTLGAAGVIETLLSMEALDRGIIPPTRGYSEEGTTYKLNLQDTPRTTDKKEFFKILSGFGGSNAGVCYSKNPR